MPFHLRCPSTSTQVVLSPEPRESVQYLCTTGGMAEAGCLPISAVAPLSWLVLRLSFKDNRCKALRTGSL